MNARLLALVPAAIAINLVVGGLVNAVGLPLYLDSIGTILATVLAGPAVGMVVGAIGQLLFGLLYGYQWIPFGLIQLLIALLAGAAAARAGFRSTGRTVAWGLLTGALAGSLSAVISYILFKGVTATGTTAVVTLLRHLGWSLPAAVTASSLALDLVDKAVAFVLVGALVRSLPGRMLGRFPRAARALGR
ncbi:MAG TPA: ECF transporter S component [Gemmatimonadales bacterium]|nr:ECF transporter S component [Gemmatimonadales bacterium]